MLATSAVIDGYRKYYSSFDGSGAGNYIDFLNPIIPAGEKRVLIEMSKTSPPVAQEVIFANDRATQTYRGDYLILNTSGQAVWFNTKGGSRRFLVTGSTNICDGDKHIAELVWDGTTNADAAKIYVDGVQDGSGTADSTETLQGEYDLTIGRSGGATPYYLTAKIYKLLISDASGYVAKYLFREGSGTTLYDTSGNGYNGTITGATWERFG